MKQTPMCDKQTLALLTERLGKPLKDTEQALALAAAVSHVPLALALAAAQIADGMLWNELLEILRHVVGHREHGDNRPHEQRGLRAMMKLSLNRLRRPISPACRARRR